MSLSRKFLPDHHFHERHEIVIDGTPRAILNAVAAMRPAEDRLVRQLMMLRRLPLRQLSRHPHTWAGGGLPFTLLGRDDRESVSGLVGRFWRLDSGLVAIEDAEAFEAFAEAGAAKLVMSFDVQPLSDTKSLLGTETRVFCVGKVAWLHMALYWAMIRPASGLIRHRMLRIVKRSVERPPAACRRRARSSN